MWAEYVLIIATVYTLIGVVFAIAFVTKGLGTVDPAAQGGPLGFRLLMFPASAALWPVLAVKWSHASQTRPPTEPTNAR